MKREKPTATSVDIIQRSIARLVATSPAGHNLLLIGGFRHRFLDEGVRRSADIDYHWAGDLDVKQRELVTLFRRRLLPGLRRELGYEGRAEPATGPEAESPNVRTVVVSLWKPGVDHSRIEIPVEITRVLCADPPEVRTMDGIIYATPSDADLVENKIVALFNRWFLEHRDLVDVFLFADKLLPASPERLKCKLVDLTVTCEDVRKRLDDLTAHAAYHSKAIQAVIDSHLDLTAVDSINAAGGGEMVLGRVLDVLKLQLAAWTTEAR